MKTLPLFLVTFVGVIVVNGGAKAPKIVRYEMLPAPKHHKVLNSFSRNGKTVYSLAKREPVFEDNDPFTAKSTQDYGNKLGAFSKPPVFFQDSNQLYLHEFSEINTFKWRLDVMHSKLLEYVEDDNEVLDFGEDSWELEAGILRLNSDFGKLTLEANLLRAEVVPWLVEVRSLFELMQYYMALRRKYGDSKQISGGKHSPDKSQKVENFSNDGTFCLKLVKFELYLHSLIGEKWNPYIDWDRFETSLYHAEDEYELLMKEYQNLLSNSSFANTIDRIFIRLIDFLDDLNHLSQSQ